METEFSATSAAPAIMESPVFAVSVKHATRARLFLDLVVPLEVLQILLIAPAMMGTAETAFPVCLAMLVITVAAGYVSNADSAT